jgi:hypothetical protein
VCFSERAMRSRHSPGVRTVARRKEGRSEKKEKKRRKVSKGIIWKQGRKRCQTESGANIPTKIWCSASTMAIGYLLDLSKILGRLPTLLESIIGALWDKTWPTLLLTLAFFPSLPRLELLVMNVVLVDITSAAAVVLSSPWWCSITCPPAQGEMLLMRAALPPPPPLIATKRGERRSKSILWWKKEGIIDEGEGELGDAGVSLLALWFFVLFVDLPIMLALMGGRKFADFVTVPWRAKNALGTIGDCCCCCCCSLDDEEEDEELSKEAEELSKKELDEEPEPEEEASSCCSFCCWCVVDSLFFILWIALLHQGGIEARWMNVSRNAVNWQCALERGPNRGSA